MGCDGATFRFNTVVEPEHWALRILQETSTKDFLACRNGSFTDNLIVFRSTWSESGVNIGPGTAPETFRFARNFWYCSDQPARSKPNLPVPETGGMIGSDPQFRDPDHHDFTVKPGSPAARVGAHALRS